MTILAVTISDDLHAFVIQDTLAKRHNRHCEILDCTQLSSGNQIRWSHLQTDTDALLTLRNGTLIPLSAQGLVWWRRSRVEQEYQPDPENLHQTSIINNDCRAALLGALQTAFHGTWLSDPAATDQASNKLLQLAVAHSCGLRTPATLVAQSRAEVLAFRDTLGQPMIVKPVVGAAGPLLFTQFLDDPGQFAEASYSVAPAIFQEYIPGTDHIRLNCFGDTCLAARIHSDALDWRPDLRVPIEAWPVPETLQVQVKAVLKKLGLLMGIIDLKVTPAGETVWLEVNPQGQFLFLEPLTGLRLAAAFSDFIVELLETV